MWNSLVRKKMVWGLTVLLTVVSLTSSINNVSSAFNIEDNGFGGETLYVGGTGPNNYTKIQDAIDNASDGDTVFVYDDSSPYYENVVVDKTINLVGEDKNTTVIDGGKVGTVIYVSANYVNITGFTIKNSSVSYPAAGVNIHSNSNRVSNNVFVDNICSVRLQHSSGNVIKGNNINSNFGDGVTLEYSIGNVITDNIISNNTQGIFLSYSDDNLISGNYLGSNYGGLMRVYFSDNTIITGNVFLDSPAGLSLENSNNTVVLNNSFFNNGLTVYNFYRNIVFNNTVNGKPLLYLEGLSGTDIVVSEAGQVVLVNCSGIVIENQVLCSTDVGVELWGSNNCFVLDTVVASNNFHGIWFCCSHNNTVSGSSVHSNKGNGFHLENSHGNTLTGNFVSDNEWGVWLQHSTGNVLSNNNITGNMDDGVSIYNCSGITLTGNTFYLNHYCGVWLHSSSSNNIVVENDFIRNNDAGLVISSDSSNNVMYHNNFINNPVNAYDEGFNIWDNGYPSGGNYWSDFDEPQEGAYDDYHGINQDEPGCDGIVDKGFAAGGGLNPYSVPGGVNQDTYPLFYPRGVVPAWRVINLNTTEKFFTIQEAIDDSDTQNGHVLEAFPSLYVENIVVWKELTIRSRYGNPFNTTIVRADVTKPVVEINANNVTFSGFEVNGGNISGTFLPPAGINIWVSSNCKIDNCYIHYTKKGVILNSSLSVPSKKHTVSNCLISDNEIGVEIAGCFYKPSGWNMVSNCSISNNLYGIVSTFSVEDMFLGCSIHDNGCGIELGPFSTKSTVSNCNIYSNEYDGIWLYAANNNTVSDCSITSNIMYGITSYYSADNIISSCTISDNGNGTAFYIGSRNNRLQDSVISSNNENGVIGCSERNMLSNCSISSNKVGVCLFLAKNYTMLNCEVHHNERGVVIENSSGNTLLGNRVEWNWFGIYLSNSTLNQITGNRVFNNSYWIYPTAGIYLLSSTDNIVEENNVSFNWAGIWDDCIFDYYVNNNTIACNRVCHNGYGVLIGFPTGVYSMVTREVKDVTVGDKDTVVNNYLFDNACGVEIDVSTGNLIVNNTLMGNEMGVGLFYCENGTNILSNNTFISNEIGVSLYGSSNNVIYHNDFIRNGVQARDEGNGVNLWNISYPVGGNYWSDFDEPSEGAYDEYSGPSQNEPGSDGIVDKGQPNGGLNPYSVPGGENKDWYPLIHPVHDIEPPCVEIRKPEKAVYVSNKKIIPFFVTIVIGFIDVEVDASDESGINRVEFYINDVLKSVDTVEPYVWTWDEAVFGRQMIKVVAYDNAGNLGSDELMVWRFF